MCTKRNKHTIDKQIHMYNSFVTHIGCILNGHNGACSQNQFLPRFAQIDDIHTIGTTLENVLLHLEVDVLGAQVSSGNQHFGNVILFEGQYI